MDAITLENRDTFGKESGIVIIPSSSVAEGSTSTAKKSGTQSLPSESRLWKLAATETLSVEIEILLLLLVLFLGFLLVAYGFEQLLCHFQPSPVVTNAAVH
ncbi:MAG: hypothetical protein C5B58_00480 [Acidobacteria bacterium]|nr:MAG: hypothetical protein C5B58_00480 [Acidobacteriota bacterium]